MPTKILTFSIDLINTGTQLKVQDQQVLVLEQSYLLM
jgi:hypothetical protein